MKISVNTINTFHSLVLPVGLIHIYGDIIQHVWVWGFDGLKKLWQKRKTKWMRNTQSK